MWSLQNRFYTEFLALESGIQVENLSRVDFRRKSENNTASNFLQIAMDKEGNEGLPQENQQLPQHLWYYHYFKQNACNFCDDVFGGLPDITFMDAWLPEFINDHRGTSLIIARTPTVKNLLKNSDECIINVINVNKIIESQMGAIQKKRVLLTGKLYKTEKLKNWHPKKRVEANEKVYETNKEFINLTDEIQYLSKNLWPKHRLDKSTEIFWKNLTNIESEINKFEKKVKYAYLLKLPEKLFKRLLRF